MPATTAGRDDAFRLEPTNLPKLLAEDVPEPRILVPPYIYECSRTWVFGSAGVGKSLYAAWVGCELTKQGLYVVYISQENPLAVDVHRLERLRPNFDHLRFFHMPGLDLTQAEHRAELIRVSDGAALVILDTLTACWSGDENDNAQIAAIDRDVLVPLTQIGASSLVIHHTGHPQALVRREGVHAGRGASTMGQKADVVLVFKPWE
jgi:hypothetical protein